MHLNLTISDRDHPRGCGEHFSESEKNKTKEGSSPRMRGAPPFSTRDGFVSGIIPADAGSTSQLQTYSGDREDHPRGCGEHSGGRKVKEAPEGSSPRMRGAPPLTSDLPGAVRIIPADAGSTRAVGALSSWDLGSSPRMRGARAQARHA